MFSLYRTTYAENKNTYWSKETSQQVNILLSERANATTVTATPPTTDKVCFFHISKVACFNYAVFYCVADN